MPGSEPPPTQVLAGYRLLALIGQGSHGQVFRALDPALPREVALKRVVLSRGETAAADRAAFLAAADTARRLVHPAIVEILAAGVEPVPHGQLGWLAMELVPGGDLAPFTRSARLLAPRLVLQLAEQVALALAHAHRQGVVHRDLKPANVLVQDLAAGRVKLGDFGLARAADALQTGTGLVPGTPAYMAPEQLAGAVPSPQSDLYALGVMLFELLTGRLPYQGDSMGELLRQAAQDTAPDLRSLRPALSPALAALVAGLLAKRPAERPSDGDTLAAELRALRDGPDGLP